MSILKDLNRGSLWPIIAILLLLLLSSIILIPGSKHQERPSQQPLAAMDLSADCSGSWIGVLKQKGEGVGEVEEKEEREKEREPGGRRPRPSEEAPRLSEEALGMREAFRPIGNPEEPLRCPQDWEWIFSDDPDKPPPPGLQPFCRYVGHAPDPRPSLWKVAGARMEYELFEYIERDCRIVGPAAQTMFPLEEAQQLRARFERHAEGERPNTFESGNRQTRLVIVDSIQDDAEAPQDRKCPPSFKEGDYECSAHGEVLVELARRLLCGDQDDDCRVRITTRRSLHWSHLIQSQGTPAETRWNNSDPPGPARGGFSGTTKDLALAIWREVDEWRLEADRPPLILNLSVGWEPIHASATSTLGLQVRAVLEDAVCRGALVVAAAGNRRSGPPELETPLLPAAFELVPAPSAADCQALLEDGASPGPESNTDYKPLVFAVGGVQPDDRRPYKPRLLSNSRPNATPRLVAYGDHAVVSKRDRDRSLKILTGTSVSTLVVSAAAGERWRLDPDLGSFDVMQDLFNDGMETDIRSDFDLDSARPLARKVFVHTKPAVPPPPWPAGEPAPVLTSPAVSMSFSAITSLGNCNPGILRGAQVSAGDPELCPQRLLDIRLQPGLGPQPDSGHNPGCRFGNGSPGTLWLEFDPCYRVQGKPVRLSDLTLIVADRAYRLPIEPFWLGDPSLPCPMNTPDDPRRKQVVLTDFNLERPLDPMYLAVTVNNTRATLSPILQLLKQDE